MAVDFAPALDRAESARRRSPAGRDRVRWAHALGRRRGDPGGPSTGPQRDVHSLAWHPGVPGRAYEAGGGGAAFSIDAGETWQPADEGRDRNYTWSVAVDPDDPDCWYLSASTGPFAADGRGDPQALLYRRRGQGAWRPLGGGLPDPLLSMPMRSSPRGDGSSRASPTGRSGRATTAETAGPRCGSAATRSLHSSLSRMPATDSTCPRRECPARSSQSRSRRPLSKAA